MKMTEMNKGNKKRIASILTTAMLAAMLAGCGGGQTRHQKRLHRAAVKLQSHRYQPEKYMRSLSPLIMQRGRSATWQLNILRIW